MALDAMWAVLIPEVSGVSKVQATVYEDSTDTPLVLPEVSEVSGMECREPGSAMNGDIDTPDTPTENVRYQPEPAWALGCTLDTSDTAEKIDADDQYTEAASTLTQSEPKRLFRERGPWLTDGEKSAAQSYHKHHFHCPQCVSAGLHYGRRCAVGLALWLAYMGES